MNIVTRPSRNSFVTLTRWLGTTAYQGIPSDGLLGKDNEKLMSWLPFQTKIKAPKLTEMAGESTTQFEHDNDALQTRTKCDIRKELTVQVGFIQQDEWQCGMDLMNHVIREGKSWPFDEEFTSLDAYRGYFLSHTAIVVRHYSDKSNGLTSHDETVNALNDSNSLIGCFYIKPNFPGRCSHVCNGGFITNPVYANCGVGKLMGQTFIRAARDLGYKSAYFNLVFASNTVSVRLWESLGFQRVAELKKAANLRGVPGLDTAYGYWYDLEKET